MLNANAGDSTLQTQVVTITNCGTTIYSWSATISNGSSWLTTDQNNGSLESGKQTYVQISASAASLSVNQYTGSITFTPATTPSQAVTVTVTFNVQPPALTVDKTQLPDDTCNIPSTRDVSRNKAVMIGPSSTIEYCTVTLREQGSGDLHWTGVTDTPSISGLLNYPDDNTLLSSGDLSTAQPTQQVDIAVNLDRCLSSQQITFTFTGTASSDGTPSQQIVTFTCPGPIGPTATP
jgi:hypothetical protein